MVKKTWRVALENGLQQAIDTRVQNLLTIYQIENHSVVTTLSLMAIVASGFISCHLWQRRFFSQLRNAVCTYILKNVLPSESKPRDSAFYKDLAIMRKNRAWMGDREIEAYSIATCWMWLFIHV